MILFEPGEVFQGRIELSQADQGQPLEVQEIVDIRSLLFGSQSVDQFDGIRKIAALQGIMQLSRKFRQRCHRPEQPV